MITFMVQKGLTARQACDGKKGAPYEIKYSTLQRWWYFYRFWGLTPAMARAKFGYRFNSGQRAMARKDTLALKRIVDANPSLFIDEMRHLLHTSTGTLFALSTVHRYLTSHPEKLRHALNYSLRILTFKATQARKDERAVYRAALRRINNPRQFIFVDECHVTGRDVIRKKGYGRRGVALAKHEIFRDHSPSAFSPDAYTLIAAIDMDHGFVQAACTVVHRKRSATDPDPTRGTVNQERFLAYVRNDLCPTLGSFLGGEPRSVVVMDNATVHKDPRVVELIEARGAILIWSAAYSPDLNPIERCFSNFKRSLQHHAPQFPGEMMLLHDTCLRTSVTPRQIRNFYNGRVFEGCIRNVPKDRGSLARDFVVLLALGIIPGAYPQHAQIR
jgi:hypothetical protein